MDKESVTQLNHISIDVRTEPEPKSANEMYLDLLKRTLSRVLGAKRHERHTIFPGRRWLRFLSQVVRTMLAPWGLELVRLIETGPDDYLESGDAACNRAEDAETMLGAHQLDQMQLCINDVLDHDVPGDLLDAGVWRGGMTILMRAVLKVRGDTQRHVWVVDSFSGLPTPDNSVDSFWWKAGDMASLTG